MKKDNIFTFKREPVPAFEFNEEVASVFDDMIKRSVPLYMESIKRQSQLTARFYKKGSSIYDLGCSHGNLGIMINEEFKEEPYTMIAVDSSPSMIEKYRNRVECIDSYNKKHNISLVCGLAENISISNASVVIVNLTMQFIKPIKRDNFIQSIYNGLVDGGILLLTEKIINQNKIISDIEQDFYKSFKLENGYSELEISRKRDSLENVLIPETIESHIKRLKNSGFSVVEVWLKWFNFASIIAIKNSKLSELMVSLNS
ncbi:MAG: carboxy-S-adenosyl-L-methionine synthase CmoA [Desulfamplus sp.]|nr:carboxy-S-adenosyl-L-methionine synthase CmoA [Desulfamplus sp.]